MKRTNVFVIAGLVAGLMTGCSRSEQGAEEQGGARPSKPAIEAITLTPGTAIKVRTTTAISTKTHKTGDSFTATLEEPLMGATRVLAPKGAKVEGMVADADPGGRVQGVARLTVRLTKIETGDGGTLDIITQPLTVQARSTKGKDAAKIGIGSGVGAAIGAIAGGGKGAAVGAAAGAGAGTGYVLSTRGDAAAIGAERVLNFELRESLTIPAK